MIDRNKHKLRLDVVYRSPKQSVEHGITLYNEITPTVNNKKIVSVGEFIILVYIGIH